MSRPSFDALRVEATLEDPKAFQHLVMTTAILKPRVNEDFSESFSTNAAGCGVSAGSRGH
jgi:hypothetical protein